jgi:hypothetical protein
MHSVPSRIIMAAQSPDRKTDKNGTRINTDRIRIFRRRRGQRKALAPAAAKDAYASSPYGFDPCEAVLIRVLIFVPY